MACSITVSGRAFPCKDAIGGVKRIWVKAFDPDDWGSVTSGAITDAAQAVTLYGFEVTKNSSYFTETVTASVENGTVFYAQEVSITMPKQLAADTAELYELAKSRLCVIVQDNNDNYFIVGLRRGVELTGGTHQTGTATGDLNGYQLTFTAEEAIPAPFLTDGGSTNTTLTAGS
jgi:hypothetical protein